MLDFALVAVGNPGEVGMHIVQPAPAQFLFNLVSNSDKLLIGVGRSSPGRQVSKLKAGGNSF